MTAETATPVPYELGHSEDELARLARQAQLLEPTTRRYLSEAGIGPGMRVLDVETGLGDVAAIVADLVGRSGDVIGVDLSRGVIESARARSLSV